MLEDMKKLIEIVLCEVLSEKELTDADTNNNT